MYDRLHKETKTKEKKLSKLFSLKESFTNLNKEYKS